MTFEKRVPWCEVDDHQIIPRASLDRASLVCIIIGSFSIDDGNGSDNVSFKMISNFFNLSRVYSNLLKMASVGEFPESWFLEDRTQG